jgi:LPS sulfotransferase NodH
VELKRPDIEEIIRLRVSAKPTSYHSYFDITGITYFDVKSEPLSSNITALHPTSYFGG